MHGTRVHAWLQQRCGCLRRHTACTVSAASRRRWRWCKAGGPPSRWLERSWRRSCTIAWGATATPSASTTSCSRSTRCCIMSPAVPLTVWPAIVHAFGSCMWALGYESAFAPRHAQHKYGHGVLERRFEPRSPKTYTPCRVAVRGAGDEPRALRAFGGEKPWTLNPNPRAWRAGDVAGAAHERADSVREHVLEFQPSALSAQRR